MSVQADGKKFNVVVDGKTRRVSSAFYRGELAHYMPRQTDLDRPSAIVDYVLKGWMPEKPFIGPTTNVVAFGSCFAANIGRYLTGIGYDIATQREGAAYIQRISDGLVNVHAISQQFEWAWENRVPSVQLWHGWKAEEYGYDEEIRLETKKLFDAADVFILTFGLSEIWYDEPTGEVFWRAIPLDKFDPARHKFRVATYNETLEKIRHIYSLIRTNRPNAKIIFTLSPVGLAATFRPVSCITANSSSKALLRAAIDELYRAVSPSDPDFYYFPSYEVVCHGFHMSFRSDLRHPRTHVLTANMRAFERYFCLTGLTDEGLHASLQEAIEMDQLLLRSPQEERDEIEKSDKAVWRSKYSNAVNISHSVKAERKRQRQERRGDPSVSGEEAAAERKKRRLERRARSAAPGEVTAAERKKQRLERRAEKARKKALEAA